MEPRKILVLNGHPMATSLSKGLTDAYANGAISAGHDVRHRHLSEMKFEIDFGIIGYEQSQNFEKDVQEFVTDLQWADHIVIATPLWWGGIPAKLKGLFDRALLPGLAYDPRVRKMGLPQPLLTEKSARILLTADTPMWAMRLFYRRAFQHQITRQILGFVGIKPTRHSHFAPVEHATPKKVESWLEHANKLGQRAA